VIRAFLCLSVLLACASATLAATFTVSVSNGSGPGTVTQAIVDANANPGRDRIVFTVASADAADSPNIKDVVDIDGTVGSGRVLLHRGVLHELSPAILELEASGSSVRNITFDDGNPNAVTLWADASTTTLENLTLAYDSQAIHILSSGNRVNNVDGGTLHLQDSEGTTTEDSTFFRVSVRLGEGTRIGRTGAGNRIGTIDLFNAPGTIIEANTLLGRSGVPSIRVTATVPQAGVTIADNDIDCDAVGIDIQASNSAIRGNTIRTCSTGVLVRDAAGVEITANSIFGGTAGSVPIELGAAANDAAPDSDDGPNHLQNHPVLTSAELVNGDLIVHGTLTSARLTPYRIELFANPGSDPQMRTLLTSFIVTTDAAGVATFHPTVLRAGVAPGEVVTATATNKGAAAISGNGPNDTSEISAPVPVIASASAGASIPTASTWALLALTCALAAAGVLRR
jgi:hypothetical protein